MATQTEWSTSEESLQRLRIYLNDHLAGATAGTNLARRVARAAVGSPHEAALDSLARQIAEDRQALLETIRALGLAPQRTKAALGWVGERAGLLKSNGRLVRRSRLSPVLELEALRLGVQGKLLMWQALVAVAQEHSTGLDVDRLRELAQRAERQIATLDDMRGQFVRRAFG